MVEEVTPLPEIQAIQDAARRTWGFDKQVVLSRYPGALRTFCRTQDKANKKGEFWPQMSVYRSVVEIIGWEWRLSIHWYPVEGRYNWHEQGYVPALDKEIMAEFARTGPAGLEEARIMDEGARKQWPYRGTRGIPGIGTSRPRALGTDVIEAPKKGKKGLSPEEVKYAWLGEEEFRAATKAAQANKP